MAVSFWSRFRRK